jgi:Fe2+ transport system protein FeoA
VRESAPFDGPVTVRVGGADHAISRELAARISVS